MDITFEEVAYVIQDARYQQAIFDPDVPKPEKRFPLPKGDFKPSEFVISNRVRLHTVVYEPLGRFFLGKIVLKDEIALCAFADAVFDLRRMDPGGNVQAQDIAALCERFEVKLLPLGVRRSEDEDGTSVETTQAMDSPKTGGGKAWERNGESGGGRSGGGNVVLPTVVQSPPPSPSVGSTTHKAVTKASTLDYKSEIEEMSMGDGGGSKNLNADSVVTRFDERQHGDMTSPPPLSTYAQNMPSVNTYGEKVAATISRAMALARQPSMRSLNINRQVMDTIEVGLKPAYDRLVENKTLWNEYLQMKWFSMEPVGDKQVRYHRVLGIGAFGTVNGCIVASVGAMLAMKSMMKKRIKKKNARSQVTAERDALEALAAHPSPYCMRLRYAYQTKEAYHLILPLAIGGDLKFHLKDGGFAHERAKIYAAEVALGLGHIHSLGLIIRDLKPRNILLNSSGHTQISDFGLAVSIADGRTMKGRAGTEGYWSPEVINGTHYSIDADWWSYGCCVFEFISGISPFSSKHTGMESRNQGTRKSEIKFPEGFDDSAKPLILGLLNRDVVQRVGCRGQSLNEILSESWAYWKGFDMGAVRRNEMPAPWTPEKGHIYAASQSEIQGNDNEAEIRKVRILPEDEIPFDPFIDIEDHQRDIVKVLSMKLDKHVSLPTRANGGKGDGADSEGCCTVL